jgi:transcriptional regulator with XRE-family HTH domain
MDVRELVLEALHTLETDQAGLAKRLGRSQATVSRWVSGDTTPDYESCLRLARIIGVPARRVLQAAGLDTTLVPDDTPDAQPRLDPRLVTFLAEIEAGWLSMDTPIRDVAERGALALFAVPPTQKRAIGRQDAAAKRLKATDRKLSDRRANEGDEGSSGPLINRSRAVARFANAWHSTQTTAMGTL